MYVCVIAVWYRDFDLVTEESSLPVKNYVCLLIFLFLNCNIKRLINLDDTKTKIKLRLGFIRVLINASTVNSKFLIYSYFFLSFVVNKNFFL